MTEEKKFYRVRGSYRTEREIKTILGKNPNICSGFLPKGNFNVTLSENEFQILKKHNIKITLDKRFIEKRK